MAATWKILNRPRACVPPQVGRGHIIGDRGAGDDFSRQRERQELALAVAVVAPDAEHLRFGDGLEREPQLGCLEDVAVPDAALRAGIARECRGGILARGEGAGAGD